MKLNIELGEKISEPSTATMSSSKDKMYYPELHLTSDEELDIPETGTMVIQYKKVGYSSRNGKHTCDLEVHKVISADETKGPSAPSKRDKSAEEALDALAKEKSANKAEEEAEGEY